MSITRTPRAPLRPFVQLVWFAEPVHGERHALERMLPSGAMHLAVRLAGPPVRIVDDTGTHVLGHVVIGGARSRFYVRDVSAPARSVGAVLYPGAALPLLGVPADELAERHVPLDAIWPDAAALRERMASAPSATVALDLFEDALAARLPRVRGIDPWIAHAVARFDAGEDVAAVVDAVGISHRHFLARFREAVGLAPKRYCRVRRVLRVLGARGPWAQVAAAAGFSDQAHLTRELREIAGITPGELRRSWSGHGLHVPIDRDRSDSFKTLPSGRSKLRP